MRSYDELIDMFEHIFKGQTEPETVKALLINMYDRGETAQEIAAAAMVMREHSIKLPISEAMHTKIIDNCGTGGDKSGSFNISTTASILLSATGSYVAKHGNRSITSKSGSADLLEALDINLNLEPIKQVQMLEECGFTFMFAANHHPAMKYIMPIRKSLNHRTIFNILGPLTNPAGVKKQLIGVFDKDYIAPVIEALKLGNTEKAIVVSSDDGMDEIGISTITHASILDTNTIKSYEIDPQEYGFKLAPQESILGGTAMDNAAITQGILSDDLHGAKRDVVILNAATALIVDGQARDMQDGIEIAQEAINSGKAKEQLEKIIKISNQL